MKLIPLSKGRAFAKVDDADFDWLITKGPWQIAAFADGRAYARRSIYPYGRRVIVWMHRAIHQPPDDMHVDHIDGDGLNNQRANLRSATARQNQYNKPSHRSAGVFPYWDGKDKWRAQIWHDGKKVSVGVYLTKGEAQRAYTFSAYHLRDGFAPISEPPDFDMERLGPSMRARIEAILRRHRGEGE